MRLGKHEISSDRTFIIAEAGTNYASPRAGSPCGRALKYTYAAAEAGADAVKFQMFVPDEPLFCPVEGDDRRWERWALTCMPPDDWRLVKAECERHGLVFLASAFQPTAVQWLKSLGVEAYKVASRARETYPYDSVPGPFIVSTNFNSAEDLSADNAAFLHCVPIYPAPLEFHCFWPETGAGLSDHTGDIWAGLHAITHGASMLEVHFSIHDDKHDAGNDAPVCLTLDQLEFLCEARDVFAALRSD